MSSPSSIDPAAGDRTVTANVSATCGACGVSNPEGAPFCSGCGHALQEPCGNCTKPVQLSQAFCGHCGNDLKAALAKRRSNLETKIADAINAAKDRDFDRALGLLDVVMREKDFRFLDIVGNAEVARRKIDSVASQESSSASDRMAAAQKAFNQNEWHRVIELLEPLPQKLLTTEAETILRQSQERKERIEQADASLQEAFQKRDWAASGAILDTLMELKPEDASVAKLAVKVGGKLIKKATELCGTHKYSAAGSLLDCVPSNARGDDYTALCDRVDRMQWFAAQFVDEPFCTPTLGRLAKRWAEESGGDPKATEMLAKISDKIKGARRDRRDLFAPLFRGVVSWAGGPVGLLANPKCIDAGDNKTFRSHPGQFNAAIGLALQGLGLGRVSDDFTIKKGLLKRLGLKKSTSCWGLDIGSWSIKAVRLERTGNGVPQLAQCEILHLETPLTRTLNDEQAFESISQGIKTLLEEHSIASESVWVSLPARELVSRFVKLPPVADKQARSLFEKEIESQIPMPLDEVSTVTWLADQPEEELTRIGRPAFASATKLQFIHRYMATLESAGLNVAGLQATSIALVNFVSSEFDDLFSGSANVDDQAEESLAEESLDVAKLPTVTYFDCGAEMTTVLIVNAKSSWFWSFESGGHEFSRLLSRVTKLTHAEAEKLKRNPAALAEPESQFSQIEQRIDEIRMRIAKAVSGYVHDHDEFDCQETWCGGGGALTHGWIKRVLCDH